MMTLLSLLACLNIQAGTAEVSFADADKFRDIESGEMHKAAFRANVLKGFNKHFNRLAKKLPESQKLKVKITDLDLAGSTFHSGLNRTRVVSEVYYPKIEFTYKLLASDMSVLVEGEEKLKDSNFMSRAGSIRMRQDALRYEKRMLDKWFKSFIKQQSSKVAETK